MITLLIDEKPRLVTIDLDWREYFKEFDRLHGGDPVVYRNRLLYRDGFTHSLTDHRGPEWPPPENANELKEFKLFYWRRRKRIIEVELKQLTDSIAAIKDTQSERSAPLQQVVRFRDENGRLKTERRAFCIDDYNARILWLEQELTNCAEELKCLSREE